MRFEMSSVFEHVFSQANWLCKGCVVPVFNGGDVNKVGHHPRCSTALTIAITARLPAGAPIDLLNFNE